MPSLKLFTFHLAPYAITFVNGNAKQNAASAYIYYAAPEGCNPDEAYDHEGNSIGTFMNDDRRNALEHHVRNVIVPSINAGFIYSPYIVTDVDFTNMAPHPHLVIKCRDNKPLNESDLAQMKAKLEKIIDKLNHPSAPTKLFDQSKKMDAADKNIQRNHDLRSHRRK